MNDSADKGHMISEARGPESNSQPRASTLSDRVRSLRLPNEVAGGRSAGRWLPWTLCVILLLSTLGLGFQALRGSNSAPAKPTANTGVAGSEDVVLESKGYIIPAHQIQVSPKVSGMVEELYIEEGRFFEKGQILAVLEKVDYQAEHDRAVGALAVAEHRLKELTVYRPEEIKQAKAEWEENKAQLDQLLQDYNRSVKLQDTRAMATREIEQAESAYKAMARRVDRLQLAYELMKLGPRDAKINAAGAEVNQAEADLTKARWRLDNCTVRAPVSGTILTKKAEKGNIVNPIAFNVSASLCDMADLSDLEVDLTIQERDISHVFKGQRCRIVSEAFPKRKPYEGVVSRLMPTADRAKGAIPVRVKVKVPREIPPSAYNAATCMVSSFPGAMAPILVMAASMESNAFEGQVYLKPDMGVIVSFLKKE